MDANLTQRRRGLEEKIPDIQKTLHMVEFLNERRVSEFVYLAGDFPWCLPSICHAPTRNFLCSQSQNGKKNTDGLEEDLDDLDLEDDETSKKPLVTTFELNETLYAEAELEDTDVVYLWLGVRLFIGFLLVSMALLTESLQ